MVDSTVYDTSQVASVPVLRQAPTWEYPRDLRDHGVTGRVAFTVVIGADGLPDSSSIVVDSATNAAFVAPARKSLVGTLFYPACRYGRPVRVRIQQAYAFMINGKGR